MTLRPYQETGRDFLASRSVALLADEMRVGKTPPAILAADAIGAKRVLVVCPAIARQQWVREWARWSPARAPAVILPQGPLGDGVHIVSYGQLEPYGMSWDVVIIDECHYVKNPESQRTLAVFGPGGVAHRAGHVWCLSGTPAPNHAGELWPMLRAFDVVGLSYAGFIRRYCNVDALGVIHGTKAAMIPELRGLLARVMLRRMRRDVAPDMPSIGFDFLEVEPDTATLAELQKEGDPKEQRRLCAMAKTDALAGHVYANQDQTGQTVVFGYHIDALKRVQDKLCNAQVPTALIYGATPDAERQRIIAAFRAGDIEVVVANVIAAGTAIDLSAAHHGYFLELDWVPSTNVQAAARLVSMAKNQPVTYDVATWPNSVDEAVQSTLLRKTKELSQLMGVCK